MVTVSFFAKKTNKMIKVTELLKPIAFDLIFTQSEDMAF